MRRDLNNSQSQTNLENSNNLTNSFRKEQANELLSSVILSNSLYGIATLIFSFQLDFNGNLLAVIYFIDSKLVLQLIHQLYYYRIFSNLNMKYNHTIIRITQIVLEGCFVLMLNIFSLTNHQDILILSNIFPVLNIFVSVLLKINEGNHLFKQSVQQINLFYVFRHLAILFITLFISLKLEHYFDMDWLYTLWLFWILFSLTASITIYFIFVNKIRDKNFQVKFLISLVITNVCILFFMISCTSMFFLIPIQILKYFNIGQYSSLIDATRIILIINQVIFSYFTTRFKQELVISLSSYLSLNDSINPMHSLTTQQGELQLQQYNKQNFVESQVTEAHVQIPKLVKRISKTYFGFDDILIDKNLKKQVEPQTASDKKPSHHRAFSSQVQKGLETENDKIRLASLMNLRLSEGPDINDEQPSFQNKMNISEQQCQVSLSSVNQCCICFDNEPDALFMKCGHGGICYRCAIDMWKNSDECYLCRNKIERVLQIKIFENNKNLYKVIGATEVNQKNKKNEKIAQQVEQQ